MLFNSYEFAVFFTVVFGLYWALQGRWRAQNVLLLAASYVFYGWWDARFLFLFVLTTVMDFSAALMIERGRMTVAQRVQASAALVAAAVGCVALNHSALGLTWHGLLPSLEVDGSRLWTGAWGGPVVAGAVGLSLLTNLLHPLVARLPETVRRRLFLASSIVVNLSILGVFKYFNFFVDSLSAAVEATTGAAPDRWTLQIVLPVGISFYTFQTMSYTIDVYRRQLTASERWVEFASYLAFFPQLVAGPIERASHLLPQFRQARPALSAAAAREGAWLVAWGLFKKMFVADNLAALVNGSFAPYDALTTTEVPADGLRLLVALYAFAVQIYCDFSGYSDVARGCAKLLGFELMVNFRLPYFATSPSEFWQRWHISLSSWLRDYLYIPLGGNRGTSLATYRNLMLTMLLGGLWHGASWTFVAWGAYQGLLLCGYRALGIRTEGRDLSLARRIALGVVFFHLTCIGWLLFRAQNLTTVGVFLESIVLHPFGSPAAWADLQTLLFYSWFLLAFQAVQAATCDLQPLARWPWFARLNAWIYVVMSILVLASPHAEEFIYFAF